MQNKLRQLETMNAALVAHLREVGWDEAAGILLEFLLEETGSDYGFLGASIQGQALHVFCHRGIVWDRDTNREFYESALQTYRGRGYLVFENMDSLFGKVVQREQALLANDAPGHEWASGVPSGHPPLRRYLGVPTIMGGEVVGIISLANREAEYTGRELAQVEEVAHVAGVFCDSYRREYRERVLEEQLLQSQKMDAIGRLAGGIAHEFSNRLAVILNTATMARADLDGEHPTQGSLEFIQEECERSASLTRQILAFGRKQVLKPRVVDPNALLAESRRMLDPILGEVCELDVEVGELSGNVRVDPVQLQQVLLNIVLNARDAMPDGGTIRISTSEVDLDADSLERLPETTPGSFVRITIRDEGDGMEAETLSKIFEPFFTTKEEKGVGLGLAVAHGIVQQSGGQLGAESVPGAGTTLTIHLPMVEEEPDSQPDLRTEGEFEVDVRGDETVLLAEDDEGVRFTMRAVLQRQGYRVLEARDGREALAVLERFPGQIHVLVTDVVMPGLDGADLARAALRREPRLKVLLTSGYSDGVQLDDELAQAGADFLPKPASPRTICERIRALLAEDAKHPGGS